MTSQAHRTVRRRSADPIREKHLVGARLRHPEAEAFKSIASEHGKSVNRYLESLILADLEKHGYRRPSEELPMTG